MASTTNEMKVLEMLNKEFRNYFIPERFEAITLVLKTRFNKIKNI